MDFKILVENLKKIEVDNKAIKRKIEEYENNKLQEKIFFLQSTTPKKYWKADIKNINIKIKEFINNDKIFCWICGDYGIGKTYSIYAIRNNYILKNNFYFNIFEEDELNYDINFKRINAIDNITLIESKMKFLSQFWFDIINFHWKNEKKLFLTSTQNIKNWINALNRFYPEHAGAIASRLSNVTDIIELVGVDKRKSNIRN